MWILIVLLLLLAVGGFPAWPHAHSWGYGPSGVVLLVVLVLVVLALRGRA